MCGAHRCPGKQYARVFLRNCQSNTFANTLFAMLKSNVHKVHSNMIAYVALTLGDISLFLANILWKCAS
jgi:hypothetical protein